MDFIAATIYQATWKWRIYLEFNMLCNFYLIMIIFSITEIISMRPKGAAALLQLALTKPSDLLSSPTRNWEKRTEENCIDNLEMTSAAWNTYTEKSQGKE